MTKNVNVEKSFDDYTHTYGRIWIISAIILMLAFPVMVCLFFNVLPEWQGLLKGLLAVLPLFWTVGIIEFITYVPMLGSAGSYLSFVTGNMSNLKVPCALNAMDKAGVSADSEEGELISTISMAVSSIVTTVVIALGVLLTVVSDFDKVLSNPVLTPAFANVLPALFGALGVVFISKNWKVAIAPVAASLIFFICFPTLGNKITTLFVPVSVIVAIVAARIMYKTGFIGGKNEPVADVLIEEVVTPVEKENKTNDNKEE